MITPRVTVDIVEGVLKAYDEYINLLEQKVEGGEIEPTEEAEIIRQYENAQRRWEGALETISKTTGVHLGPIKDPAPRIVPVIIDPA